jgi:hypothetical protein
MAMNYDKKKLDMIEDYVCFVLDHQNVDQSEAVKFDQIRTKKHDDILQAFFPKGHYHIRNRFRILSDSFDKEMLEKSYDGNIRKLSMHLYDYMMDEISKGQPIEMMSAMAPRLERSYEYHRKKYETELEMCEAFMEETKKIWNEWEEKWEDAVKRYTSESDPHHFVSFHDYNGSWYRARVNLESMKSLVGRDPSFLCKLVVDEYWEKPMKRMYQALNDMRGHCLQERFKIERLIKFTKDHTTT